ncbi:MAG: proliferating cell nuclear antigen (pcna) [Candidatus Bathyarchaeia archaeon]
MFKVIIADGKTWKNFLSAISTLVEEATFSIANEGVSLRAMDPSHVAMVDFESPKESFQEYSCDEAIKLCVDVPDMLKLMRRVDAGETLELSHDPKAAQLLMKLVGKFTRKFSIPTLQPSTSDMPTPKLSFDAKIKMDADSLNDAITDIGAVSEQIKFEANTEKLIMSGVSETGNVVIEFDKGNQAVIDYQVGTDVKALYGVNFLQDMIRAGAVSSKLVKVEFSADKPIKIDFELPQQGKLVYYLAPRLE